MIKIEDLVDFDAPFSLSGKEKDALFLDSMNTLTRHHSDKCEKYRNLLSGLGFDLSFSKLEDAPYIPVRLFKHIDLMSISRDNIFKILNSSGTSGTAVSRIFLDKENTGIQVKVLKSIVSSFIGKGRKKMLVVDNPNILTRRDTFSARAAGVIGFSVFSKGVIQYTHNQDLEFDYESVANLINESKESGVLIFGFTFLIWKLLVQELINQNMKLDFGKKSFMFHGGGWKKLEEEKVENHLFKSCIRDRCGPMDIHNYYGMVEQTGSIFVECSQGHLHASNFSEVIVRDPINFKPLPPLSEGVIQLLSLLPVSYPGHSILTEDVGYILGKDDCKCGMNGTYFHVTGRLKSAELRGCSDTRAI